MISKTQGLISILAILLFAPMVYADTHVASSCSLSDVQDAINAADAGDIVTIPVGDCAWGASSTSLSVNKAITLQGAGTDANGTNITLSDTGPTYGSGVISITAAATVKSFSIVGSDSAHVTAFTAATANNWRITDVKYAGGSSSAYFIYVDQVYGLIDNCEITGGHGSSELIFARGPTESWSTVNSLGGANNLFVEDCVFGGSGYVSDINANGRAVFRFNEISGQMKIDGHGRCSNSPERGVRHLAIYENEWTNESLYWTAMEIRGGTGMVFNNHNANSNGGNYLQLREYSAFQDSCGAFNGCQCPEDYPIADQIGRGYITGDQDSEPMYLWSNTYNISTTWNPVVGDWAIPGDCSACEYGSFSEIIQSDRDYFKEASGAGDGTTGVGVGTLASRPATCDGDGEGYWATDQGDWNTKGDDGVLYVCNSANNWTEEYEPYTYPHPLQSAWTVSITGDTEQTESEFETGGKTWTLTISGGVWAATLDEDNAITTAFLAGFDSDKAEATGFDAKWSLVDYEDLSCTTTVCTLTLPAITDYNITASETITVDIDPDCVTDGGENSVVAEPTLSITYEPPVSPPLDPPAGGGSNVGSGGQGSTNG